MDDVKQAVLKQLTNTVSENIELNGIRIVKGADIVRNNANYAVKSLNMSGYNGRNKAIFSVTLYDEKMATRDITVEAAYDIMLDVLVTSKALAIGSALSEDDFYVVKQKSSKLPPGAVSQKRDIEGKVLKTNIGQGVIIRTDYLTAQANIKRGQKVNVVVEGDNVVISTHGLLRSDAIVGGTAKVLCESSKKEVIGVLISPNTVKVKI
jgi:flagella basal body P-ring formation protein FlgA